MTILSLFVPLELVMKMMNNVPFIVCCGLLSFICAAAGSQTLMQFFAMAALVLQLEDVRCELTLLREAWPDKKK